MLPVASCQLRVASCGLRVTGWLPLFVAFTAVANWQLATRNPQLATGNWQLQICHYSTSRQSKC